MPRQKAKQPDAADRLAALLRDALCAAWAAHNQHHKSPEFAALRHLGNGPVGLGFHHVARQLLARGVRPPPTPAQARKRARRKKNAPADSLIPGLGDTVYDAGR